jgi:repressor LexA
MVDAVLFPCTYVWSMEELTSKQQKVLDYIRQGQQMKGQTPSLREIAKHMGVTLTAAADHVRALKRKGALKAPANKARSLQVLTPWDKFRSMTLDVPLYGAISAGFAQDRKQEAKGCISIDIDTLGVRSSARTFALEVRGDSMIGKHIMAGDYVILEHGRTPRPGDVVAALVDNESALKTYVVERGKPCLRSENPKFPRLIPADELVIQGVMVGLVRKTKGK